MLSGDCIDTEMIFFPAIDLKDGKCVRLFQGDMEKETVFNEEPPGQAQVFADAGADWLHVVDLNGAVDGHKVNERAVKKILENNNLMVQLGGGIRHRGAVDFWLERGVKRVVLGTAAVKNPDFVKQACIDHPGHVAVGIDAKEGIVKIEGWTESSGMKTLDVARRFEDSGAAAIIYTDIARDGAMKGPNIEATMELANAVSLPVIASGGVSSMADLEALKAAGENKLQGVIIGRALYEETIDPAAVVKLMESQGVGGTKMAKC